MSEQGPTTRDRDLGREGLEELAFRVIDAGGRPCPSPLEPLDVLYWSMPDGSQWSATWVSGGQLIVRVVADRGAAIGLVDGWLAGARYKVVVNLLASLAREYLHRYGTLMAMAGEDVTRETMMVDEIVSKATRAAGGGE